MKRLILLVLAVSLMSAMGSVWAAEPLVRYVFNEGSGDTVFDSGSGAPLNLIMADPGSVSWISGGGISLDQITILDADGPPTKIIDACMASNEIAIAVRVKPANDTQGGPARMVTLSFDGGNRNVSFTQDGNGYQVRLRTTTAGNNGTIPALSAPDTIATDVISDVVYTRDAAGEAKLYLNGDEVAVETVGGDFSNWDASYSFALGHEIGQEGTRSWLGEIYYVAIYDQVLAPGDALASVEAQGKLAVSWGAIRASR